MKPFSENASSVGLGGLTVENGLDRVAIYGSLQIDRTKEGRILALQLKSLADAMVAALDAERNLPDRLEPAVITQSPNPFA